MHYQKVLQDSLLGGGNVISPFLAINWNFIVLDKKIVLLSNETPFHEMSYESYIEKYLFNPSFSIQDNTVIESFYFSSVGLVSEEDFMLAEDIIERYSKRIKNNNLVVSNVYLSDIGEYSRS